MAMPNIDLQIFATAFFLGGLLPSLLWLWFWLKEDEENPEPGIMLALIFAMGIATVIMVLPIQRFVDGAVGDGAMKLILWATAEEALKFLAVVAVLAAAKAANEPIDWPIYLITAALGFATLENTLFVIKPLSIDGTIVALLTGQLRFLGSTLLHTVASGVIGIALGLSFFMGRLGKAMFAFFGFILAVSLHSIFNFFIINKNGSDFMKVFAFLWVATIIVMLLFEKVRRMSKHINH
jgi:protease PrsW